MKWASSLSEKPEVDAAIEEAAAAARDRLGPERADLLMVFASPHHAGSYEEIVARTGSRFDGALLLGCSGGGIIGGGHEVEHRPALSVTVASLPGVTLAPFHLQGDEEEAQHDAAGWRERLGLAPDTEPHFLLLPDPFTSDAATFLRSLDAAFPRARKVGGLASGGGPGHNALFLQRKAHRNGLVGVAMSGNIDVETLVAQGCRPVGEPLIVTRAQDNLILELGGQPPVKVLRDLYASLGEGDQELFRHSLFVGLEMNGERVKVERPDLLVRNLLGIEQSSGGLAVAAATKQWQVVQFLLRDAKTAADDLSRRLGDYRSSHDERPPRGALLFSCLGRGMHLFGRPDHDTDLFHEHLGRVPLGGFFCNGEIGPVGGSTFLHGYTSAFGLFREK